MRRGAIFFRAEFGFGRVSVVDGLGKANVGRFSQAFIRERGYAFALANGVSVFDGSGQTKTFRCRNRRWRSGENRDGFLARSKAEFVDNGRGNRDERLLFRGVFIRFYFPFTAK